MNHNLVAANSIVALAKADLLKATLTRSAIPPSPPISFHQALQVQYYVIPCGYYMYIPQPSPGARSTVARRDSTQVQHDRFLAEVLEASENPSLSQEERDSLLAAAGIGVIIAEPSPASPPPSQWAPVEAPVQDQPLGAPRPGTPQLHPRPSLPQDTDQYHFYTSNEEDEAARILAASEEHRRRRRRTGTEEEVARQRSRQVEIDRQARDRQEQNDCEVALLLEQEEHRAWVNESGQDQDRAPASPRGIPGSWVWVQD